MAKGKNINVHKQTCDIDTARKIVEDLYEIKEPVIVWGNPGIGKSQMVAQVAKAKGVEFIDVRLAQLGPEDVRGLPMPVDVVKNVNDTSEITKELKWIVPNFWPRAKDWKGIIFLDELNQGNPSTLNAMFQLILDRRLGDYILPDGAYVMAACNDKSVNRYVTELSAPLKNRFMHIEMVENSDKWLNWAVDNEMHPTVVGYIKSNPSKLCDFDSMKENSNSYPTPRAWAKVSEVLYHHEKQKDPSDFILNIKVGAAIGYAHASDFEVYRLITVKLPAPRDILSGKVKKLPKALENKVDVIYAMTTQLLYKLKEIYQEKVSEKIKADEWSNVTANYLQFISNYPNDEMRFNAFREASSNDDISLYSSHKIFLDYCKEFAGRIEGLNLDK